MLPYWSVSRFSRLWRLKVIYCDIISVVNTSVKKITETKHNFHYSRCCHPEYKKQCSAWLARKSLSSKRFARTWAAKNFIIINHHAGRGRSFCVFSRVRRAAGGVRCVCIGKSCASVQWFVDLSREPWAQNRLGAPIAGCVRRNANRNRPTLSSHLVPIVFFLFTRSLSILFNAHTYMLKDSSSIVYSIFSPFCFYLCLIPLPLFGLHKETCFELICWGSKVT